MVPVCLVHLEGLADAKAWISFKKEWCASSTLSCLHLSEGKDDFHDTNPAGLSLEAATLLEL